MPTVSIIITSYRRPSETRRAVESVLHQDFDSYEIIVVDDNGRDSEESILTERELKTFIDESRIIYIKHTVNRGGNAARNSGIRASSGMYISFLDSDDEFFPQKTSIQYQYMEERPHLMASVCNCETYLSGKLVDISYDSGIIESSKPLLCGRYRLSFGSSMFFRRECFDRLGFFDEKLIRNQEIDFLVRVLSSNNIHIVTDVLLRRHIDDRSNVPSSAEYASNKEYFLDKNIKKYIPLDAESIKEIYMYQYIDVARVCLRGGRIDLFAKYIVKSKPSVHSIIKLFFDITNPIRRRLSAKWRSSA